MRTQEKAALIRKGLGGEHLAPWLPGGDHQAARSRAVQGWCGGSWGQTDARGIRGRPGSSHGARCSRSSSAAAGRPDCGRRTRPPTRTGALGHAPVATAPVTPTGPRHSATPTTSGTAAPAPPSAAPRWPSSRPDAGTSTRRRCSEPAARVHQACPNGRRSRVIRGFSRSTTAKRGKAPNGA
jgi:hypothetical protein